MLVSHSTTVFYSFSKEAGRFIKREKELKKEPRKRQVIYRVTKKTK